MRLWKPNVAKLLKKRDLNRLRLLLHDRDGLIRAQAVRALGTLKAPDLVGPLLEALADADRRVRYATVQALGQLRGTQVVDSLIATLKDPDPLVRGEAAVALGEIGTQAVGPLLSSLWLGDKELRRGAVMALGEVGDLQAIKALTLALKDQDNTIRHTAAQNLERIGVFATPFLATLLRENNQELLRLVRSILVRIGSSTRHGPLAVEWLIAELQERNEKVRREVTEILLRIGPAATEPLVRTLQSQDPWIRKWAAHLLEQFRWQPRNAEENVAYLWAREEWDQLIALGTLAPAPLIDALRRGYVAVRRQAARALGRIGGEEVVQALITALQDRDLEVCRSAVQALGELGALQAVSPLVKVWEERRSGREKEPEKVTKEEQELHDDVATALSKIGPAVVDSLLAATRDKDAYVQQWVTVVQERLQGEGELWKKSSW